MIQNTWPKAIRDSMGRCCLRYEHVLTANIFLMFDTVSGQVFARSNLQLVIATLIESVIWIFMCLLGEPFCAWSL